MEERIQLPRFDDVSHWHRRLSHDVPIPYRSKAPQ